ncbi:MAG TPA: C-terminal helicase domain-containing protein, partial [Isosphaeraceae bacterium]|nr:C-terminal helicase domain-containing protein [Isosphaeraceae bacterium]
LDRLANLLSRKHSKAKVIIFTQFADTVTYLKDQLESRGVDRVAGVTGDTEDPTKVAWRFSPESNGKRNEVPVDIEFRVLVATDVLSEGQNLQDGAIVVNYDLPWAIIRLIQRAGRVDRIGQKADRIVCYSFLPAEGVERIIKLRARVRQRLKENAEVVGTDEAFFEDDRNDQAIRDLFTEKAGILDGEAETEVDLGSHAYQIWKNAIDQDPALERIIKDLPDVVYGTRLHTPTVREPEGVLLYVRTAQSSDALAWVNRNGQSITESQFAILKAAACELNTPALPRRPDHHVLVRKGVESIAVEEKTVGGQLGRPSGARFRTYERLKRYAAEVQGTLFDSQSLRRAIEDIYSYPLRQVAVDTLNRQLRSGIQDDELARRVVELREEGRLCLIHEDDEAQEPRIICSLGLRSS